MKRIAAMMLGATLTVSLVAETPKSTAPATPIPVQPQPMPLVVGKRADVTPPMPMADVPMIWTAITVVKVPSGFRSALQPFAESASPTGPFVVSERDTKLILTLLKATNSSDFLARPNLMLADKQAGFCEVGQQIPVLGPLTASVENGETVYKSKPMMVSSGMTLRMTPTLQSTTGVKLDVALQYSDIPSSVVHAKVVNANKPGEESLVAVGLDDRTQRQSLDSQVVMTKTPTLFADAKTLVERASTHVKGSVTVKWGQTAILCESSPANDYEMMVILHPNFVKPDSK